MTDYLHGIRLWNDLHSFTASSQTSKGWYMRSSPKLVLNQLVVHLLSVYKVRAIVSSIASFNIHDQKYCCGKALLINMHKVTCSHVICT